MLLQVLMSVFYLVIFYINLIDLPSNIPSELIDATERPELTPVAIAAGKLLAHRLFGKKTELMNYNFVPTVIFTPQEYGVIGLSQELAEADEKDGGIGYDNVEVFYSRFGNLEISPTHPVFSYIFLYIYISTLLKLVRMLLLERIYGCVNMLVLTNYLGLNQV